MAKSHDFEICRDLYRLERRRGCPSVIILNLGGGTLAGETSDGKVLIEDIRGCCKWAMKVQILEQWCKKNK